MFWKLSVAASVAFAALVSAGSAFACACCGTWQVVGVADKDVLNMRAGPGVRYRKIGAIPSGTGCVIKSATCRRRWCRVSYAGQSGWAHSRYLRYLK